jgi:hypothetical protein
VEILPTPAPAVTMDFTALAVSRVYGYGMDPTLPPVCPAPELTKKLLRATRVPAGELPSPRWNGSGTFS